MRYVMKIRARDRKTFAALPTSVRFDDEVETRLRRQAKRLGTTKASLVRLAVGVGLEAIERAEGMVLVRERSNWNWP